ncbi:MAG: 16S rRNA (uracil(1498)-N(3))-methyltransferase [Clostridia bacterium]|nr:16S rRNA (uracil(1498)-N(3))-methyltransferase [Clostridia bacterium]
MSRFFVEKNMIMDDIITLSKEDSAHLARVLRVTEGENLSICDSEGYEYDAEIISVSKTQVQAKILNKKENDSEPKIKVTIFQGLPKGTKMELIIQKCVEIGVYSIVPVATSRAVVKLSQEKGKGKEERWNKISMEAAKQSTRGIIPKVEAPISFKEAIDLAKKFDMAIIPYEKQGKSDFKGFLQGKSPKTIGVFIGPEGGFAEEEIAFAIENGVTPVSLGKRILRTETAPLCVLSVLMYQYDWE